MISSRRNRHLKDIRRLRRSKGDQALLEGPHLVGEAAAAGIELELVLATPAFLGSSAGRRLVPRLPRPPVAIDPALLDSVSDSDAPRGILAVASLPRSGAAALPVEAGGIYLYGAGIQDPGNVGALARVAEAGGATALCLGPGSAHPNHPRALRGSAGSLLRLPVSVDTPPSSLDHQLAAVTPRWVALAPSAGEELYAVPLDGCLILALGAEGPGLPAELRRRAERVVSIPLAPPVESLNVAVAAAVVLFELGRRRRLASGRRRASGSGRRRGVEADAEDLRPELPGDPEGV